MKTNYQHPPFRKRKIISNILLVFACIGIIIANIYLPRENTILSLFVYHALEGGLIGGLCDWFAVWKTYQAIEENSPRVADEIGQWVATDLISHETLKAQINKILDDPQAKGELIRLANQYFATEEDIKLALQQIWQRVEEPLISYIIEYDFNFADLQVVKNTVYDDRMLKTLKFCIGETLIEVSQSEKMKNFIDSFAESKNIVVKVLLNLYSVNLTESLKQYGKTLCSDEEFLSENEKLLDEGISLIALSASEYIASWNSLDRETRLETLRSMISNLQTMTAELLTKFIMSHKEKIRESKALRNYLPIKIILEFVENRLDTSVSNFIGNKIAERLKSQNPKDFRFRMEWKTRRVLENIRINGTLLGFGLGGVFGLLQYLLKTYME
ncbi:MAG: DUF445 family protein [Spirochaetota bacterium]